jgi:transposase
MPEPPVLQRAKNLPRSLTLRAKEEHEAIRFARKRQRSEEFASIYSQRARIEGSISHRELEHSGCARLATGA